MAELPADLLSLSGRSALVTGAGARVVVNDHDAAAADRVVREIAGAGGEAVAAPGDVSDWAVAEALVATAVAAFGQLDILVNNAGVLRDRTIFNISEQEWDTVLGVHLKGHAALSRFATAHWRDRSKAAGEPVYARVINTSSEAFLYGSGGQPNYAAAKAGITALTLSIHNACGRYGVKANVICPRARTAMTEAVFGAAPDGDDALSADKVAPLVAFLAAPAAEAISGQVFVVYGSMIALAGPPEVEKRFDASGPVWTGPDLQGALGSYFADRDPEATFVASSFYQLS